MGEWSVAPCTIKAARWAVEHWHYSRTMPNSRLVAYGLWEDGSFRGAVVFGRGATPNIGKPYGLAQTEVTELVRVALTSHETATTAVVAAAMASLHRHQPGLRLVVSYADEGQGHVGTIYQAGNWLYLGTAETQWFRVRGALVHPRTLGSRYGEGGQSIPWLRANVDPAAERVVMPSKHRYVMPLDRAMRRRLLPLAVPYPTRSKAQR